MTMTTHSAFKVMGTHQTFVTSSPDRIKVSKLEGTPFAWIHLRQGRGTEQNHGRGRTQPAPRPHYRHLRLVAGREARLKMLRPNFPGLMEGNVQQVFPGLLSPPICKVARQLLPEHRNHLSMNRTIYCLMSTMKISTILQQGQERSHLGSQSLIRPFLWTPLSHRTGTAQRHPTSPVRSRALIWMDRSRIDR